MALARWNDLDTEERRQLEFTRAVAARHENNQGPLPLPERDWLEKMPAPLRVGIVAHFVQQSADTGGPPAREAEAAARRHLVQGVDAFPPHLKLQGALARLLAVTGRESEALRLQEDAAIGFLERLADEDISFPLSEWYRLSGALGDVDAFLRAEEFLEKIETRLQFTPEGRPYVDLARCKAMVLLGQTLGGEPGRTLERLGGDARLPSHVRWSAVRWHIRLLDACGLSADASRLRESFDSASSVPASDTDTARRFGVLVKLDRAVRAADDSAALDALRALERLQGGIVAHILAAAPTGQAAECVARLYPY